MLILQTTKNIFDDMLYYNYTKNGTNDRDEKPEPKKKRGWKRYASLLGKYAAYAVIGAFILATLPVWIFYSIYMNWGKDAIRTLKEWKRYGWKRPPKYEFKEPKPEVLNINVWKCKGCDLPFIFSQDYFVYIETEYDERMNSYIRRHMEEMRKRAGEGKDKFTLMYVPDMANFTNEEFATAFPMYADVLTDEVCEQLRHITTAQYTNALLKKIGIDESRCKTGFLRLMGYYDIDPWLHFMFDDWDYSKGMCFAYADFSTIAEDQTEQAMADLYRFFLKKNENGLFCVAPPPKYKRSYSQIYEEDGNSLNQAELGFQEGEWRMHMLADEVRQRIEVLRQGGFMEMLLHTIGEDLLEELTRCRQRPELSRLTITDKLHIVLTDLNGREVKMPTLARALYIFYLRHEEGVEFKHLVDFKNELFAIYRMASDRTDEAKLRATIDKLVNPTENKVNECVSRIKEAFARIMDDFQAKNYYLVQKRVTYKRDNPYEKGRVDGFQDLLKKISLPRTMVSYPPCLQALPKDKAPDHEEHVRKEQELDMLVHRMQKALDNFRKHTFNKHIHGVAPQECYDAVNAVIKCDPYNYLARFSLGYLCCNKEQYATSIRENTIVIEHDDYLWNLAYINRAEAYLYAKEYEKGLVDIKSYFNSVQREKEYDRDATRIKILLEMKLRLAKIIS